MHSFRVRNQFIKHFRTLVELLVILSVLVEQANGLSVAPLGIAELLPLPIEVAQMKQQHTLLNAAAGSLLVAFFIGANGSQRVFLHQVDVTHGIIDLIEIFFVIVRTCHPLQAADHLLGVTSCHHLRHGDAGIELQFVGRIHSHHPSESLVSLVFLSEGCIELSQQIAFTGFLLTSHLMFDDFLQIRDGFRIAFGMDIIVGKGVIPFFHGTPVE